MKQKLLVELDALLDTRIATVFRMDPQAARKLLTAEYATRLSDEMFLLDRTLDQAVYEQAYAERDLETLYLARPTQLFFDMKNILRTLMDHLMCGSPDVEGLHLDVNVWPYHPTAEQQDELLSVLQEDCDETLSMGIVRESPQDLTPNRILDMRWTYLYLYNIQSWILAQYGNVKERPLPIPLVTVIGPKLVASVQQVADFTKETVPGKKGHQDPHECMHVGLSEFVNVNFACPSQFSLARLPTATAAYVEPTA